MRQLQPSNAGPALDGSWTCQPFAALSGRDVHDLLSLRAAVFVVEQDCVFQDPDDLDLHAHHFLLREEGRLGESEVQLGLIVVVAN